MLYIRMCKNLKLLKTNRTKKCSWVKVDNLKLVKRLNRIWYFFTQKVKTRLRLPTSIVREIQNMSKQLIYLQYNAMPYIKCSIERTNAMQEKYVLSGWRSFMEQYGICKKSSLSVQVFQV